MRTSRAIITLLVVAFLFSASTTASAQTESKTRSVVTGALIGAVTALAVTGWAAASYGENEGGKFCYPCMVQWSALSVPVGAGLGAGIGFAVASVRQSVGPSGFRTGRQASITFTKRF